MSRRQQLTWLQNKSDAVGLFRLRTSGSIASGDLKLGLGRYGVISAFGRKEVENFSFTPSLTGTYNENIVVENVLDGFNDQNVAVKANVRKPPTFTIEPVVADFGVIDPTSTTVPEKLGFTLTNVSKHERTFVVEVKYAEGPKDIDQPKGDDDRFADLSLSRDDVGTALSKTEEEEMENILQKLKIAKRKGKTDKIAKYEARLVELGVQPGKEVADASASDTDDGTTEDSNTTGTTAPSAEGEVNGSGAQTPAVEIDAPQYGPRHCVSLLTVVLQPNQKNRIMVELIPRSSTSFPDDSTSSSASSLDALLQVHDKKNADESQSVKVVARKAGTDMTSIGASGAASTSRSKSNTSSSDSTAALPTTQGQSPLDFVVVTR